MKITKSQLQKILTEEFTNILMEQQVDPTRRPVRDLSQMSGDEAFGFAWSKAVEFLRDSGMEDAANMLEVLADPEEA